MPCPLPQALELIETVLPFDATTFNIAKLRSGAGWAKGPGPEPGPGPHRLPGMQPLR